MEESVSGSHTAAEAETSACETTAQPRVCEVEMVSIKSLIPADSPRLAGENKDHIRTLAEVDSALPPILVHRCTMRVIDGMHRLRAAQLRGDNAIEVRFLEGDEEEMFVASVKANIRHGLPLSMADRKAAVMRILRSHPHWSDRAIAAVTGVAHTTVAVERRRSTGESLQLNTRLGRDGKVRPLDSATGRQMAKSVIRSRPDASLREIAKLAGISLGTARDVRRRLEYGDEPELSAQQGPGSSGSKEEPAHSGRQDRPSSLQSLAKDPSLRFNEAGRALLRWLMIHAIDPEEFEQLVDAVPAHCTDAIIDLAQGYSSGWQLIAKKLRQRAQTKM